MVHARNRDARRRNGPLPAFPCTDSRRSACGRRPIRQTAPKRRAAARRKAGPYAAGHARAQLHDYTWGLLKATQETKAVYRPKTRLCNPGSRIVLSGPASAVSCGESAPPETPSHSHSAAGTAKRPALCPWQNAPRLAALPPRNRLPPAPARARPSHPFSSRGLSRDMPRSFRSNPHVFRGTRKDHRTRFENLRRHPMPCGATPASSYKTRFSAYSPKKRGPTTVRCLQSLGGALREPRRRGPSPITWTRDRPSRC